jgi:DNA-binding ferritin-like protein
LSEWLSSLATVTPGKAAPSSADSSIGAVAALVAEVREAVARRLEELAESPAPATAALSPANHSRPARHRSTAGLCVRACRCCGRALGAAFKAAEKTADLATARILYAGLRAFEKQLWVLDPRVA